MAFALRMRDQGAQLLADANSCLRITRFTATQINICLPPLLFFFLFSSSSWPNRTALTGDGLDVAKPQGHSMAGMGVEVAKPQGHSMAGLGVEVAKPQGQSLAGMGADVAKPQGHSLALDWTWPNRKGTRWPDWA
ncbi:MAG: hypothetical protein Q9159_002006 [Coniocarpon cinnabarinum]